MNFPEARFDPGTGAEPGTRGYVYHDHRIVLAVNVALAVRRPLLVTGVPGSGKSTLAADVATRLGWSHVSTTITSRTRLEDLTARIDSVRRLADAHFQAEEYAEFCDTALPHLDELAHDWFTGSEFDRLLVDTVCTTFPAHEHEQFSAHYRGLIAAWSRDRPG